MAVLHELDVSEISSESSEKIIREIVARLFWVWYFQNLERKITTVKVWFFQKTFRVKDLEGVFILLFGPANASSA